ncbi:ATP-binding protein [Streptomyces aureus]|uniref:histidine kinase n=1 Tax=Streptomyces aureus TaxID=193461 RepID=A0ABV4SZI2_9ACTN
MTLRAAPREVDNTGSHVDDAVVGRLFELFYRAHSRVGSDRSGHGLGLAIVCSMATSHRETVTETANATGGLTLRVELQTLHGYEEAPADSRAVRLGRCSKGGSGTGGGCVRRDS